MGATQDRVLAALKKNAEERGLDCRIDMQWANTGEVRWHTSPADFGRPILTMDFQFNDDSLHIAFDGHHRYAPEPDDYKNHTVMNGKYNAGGINGIMVEIEKRLDERTAKVSR